MPIHKLLFDIGASPRTEKFSAIIDELGANGTLIRFSINDFEMFMVKYNTIGKLVDGKEADMMTLANIATNNDETLIAFIQRLVNQSRKIQSKKVVGQIVHNTRFRYVADVDAQITDSIFANQY